MLLVAVRLRDAVLSFHRWSVMMTERDTKLGRLSEKLSAQLEPLWTASLNLREIEKENPMEYLSMKELKSKLWKDLEVKLTVTLSGPFGQMVTADLRKQLAAANYTEKQIEAVLALLPSRIVENMKNDLETSSYSQIKEQLRCQLNSWSEPYWLTLYKHALKISGLEDSERLNALAEAVQANSWWWPMEGIAVLTERPVRLMLDDDGQLHAEDGPAVAYRDGYCGYYWHGINVPASLIDGWSAQQIMQERNSEIRRCAVEAVAGRHGWQYLVSDAGWPQVGKTVDDPGNPGQTLSLYRMEGVYPEPVNLLLMVNGTVERDGTRREFGETVPASISDPVAAAAWQIKVSPEVYRLSARRT